MRTKKEIEDMMDECAPFIAGEEASPRFGMSYEDGVDAALRWVLTCAGEDEEEINPLAE